MRLLYITTTLPYNAAVEDFFIPEITQILKQGCCLLIVPRHPSGVVLEKDLRLLNYSLIGPLFSLRMAWTVLKILLFHPLMLLRILRILSRSRGIGTLIKNAIVLPKGLWLAEIAKKWGATHIHAQWAAANASVALVASMASGIPWSFTAHRGDIVQRNLLKEKCKSAEFVRFISHISVRLAAECGVNDLGKACVIPVGVELPDEVLGVGNCHKPAVIMCPANLLPVKGHKYLIEAIALLAERGIACRLLIAGEGALRKKLEQQVESLSLRNWVHFLGFIPHNRLLEMYAAVEVDVVALPSIDLGHGLHEGIPVVLMEAMAYGVPVLSTRTGGIPELVSAGTGLLVPPMDPLALADALQKLLTDTAFRTEIGRLGRQRISSAFCAEKTALQFMRQMQIVK